MQTPDTPSPTVRRPPVFPSGITLAEARALLVGVDVTLGIGTALMGKPTTQPGDYRVVNMTRDAIICAPYLANGGLNMRRKVSVVCSTGRSRHTHAGDVVHYLHPVNHQALLQLLGLQVTTA